MKPFYLLLLFAAISFTGFSQIPSSCMPSINLKKLYASDAADMALQRMYQLHSPDTSLIDIPQRYQDTILGVIAAVCNIGTQYEADSIFRNYCVHRWPKQPFMASSITVKVDTSYAWAKQWYLGNQITGNAPLDQFLSLHGLSMTAYRCTSGSEYLNNRAVLTAKVPVNMKAFADSIRKFAGVLYYEYPGFIIGDGDHIFYTSDSDAHIRFIAGWGDCPSGCTAYKDWQYTVSLKDCSVSKDTIIRVDYYGEKHYLPHCNLIPAAVPEPKPEASMMAVYPNPAQEYFIIRSSPGLAAIMQLTDASGRLLQEARLSATGTTRINSVGLPAGLYFIRIAEANGHSSFQKLIKQ